METRKTRKHEVWKGTKYYEKESNIYQETSNL